MASILDETVEASMASLSTEERKDSVRPARTPSARAHARTYRLARSPILPEERDAKDDAELVARKLPPGIPICAAHRSAQHSSCSVPAGAAQAEQSDAPVLLGRGEAVSVRIVGQNEPETLLVRMCARSV